MHGGPDGGRGGYAANSAGARGSAGTRRIPAGALRPRARAVVNPASRPPSPARHQRRQRSAPWARLPVERVSSRRVGMAYRSPRTVRRTATAPLMWPRQPCLIGTDQSRRGKAGRCDAFPFIDLRLAARPHRVRRRRCGSRRRGAGLQPDGGHRDGGQRDQRARHVEPRLRGREGHRLRGVPRHRTGRAGARRRTHGGRHPIGPVHEVRLHGPRPEHRRKPRTLQRAGARHHTGRGRRRPHAPDPPRTAARQGRREPGGPDWSGRRRRTARGVVSYDVYQGGSKIHSVGGGQTATVVTGLRPGTAYAFTVRARDAADNLSPASAAVRLTTAPGADDGRGTAPTGTRATSTARTGAVLPRPVLVATADGRGGRGVPDRPGRPTGDLTRLGRHRPTGRATYSFYVGREAGVACPGADQGEAAGRHLGRVLGGADGDDGLRRG